MVFPLHVSNAEVDSGEDSRDGWRSPRHHDFQRDCVVAFRGAFHRSQSGKPATTLDLQYLRRGGAAVYRRDDDRGVRGEMRRCVMEDLKHCKLKIEKCKVQIS